MTPKQKLFAGFYAKSQSARAAAIAAGYSECYANTIGPKNLLKNPDVVAEVKRLRARLNETADKSATDVINEFSKIAFTDRVDFLKEDPHYPGEYIYKSPDELTPDQRAIVEKVTYTMHEIMVVRDGEPEKLWIKHYTYVLSDKSKALENMGRHFGIFDDRLKLISSQQNPFKNATPAQLEKLRSSWVGVMTDPALIEGTVEEVKK